MVDSYLIGKTSTSSLTFTLQEDGKTLDIDVMVLGNFGTGDQKAANKIINEFKEKLLTRLN